MSIDHNQHFDGVPFANNSPQGVEEDRFGVRDGGIIRRFNGPAVPQTPEPASILLLPTAPQWPERMDCVGVARRRTETGAVAVQRV